MMTWPAGGFPARFGGLCVECGNPILQGDTIAYTGPLNEGRPVHLDCTENPSGQHMHTPAQTVREDGWDRDDDR